MKRFFLVMMISCIGLFAYQHVSLAFVNPPCPCDTETVGGLTGIEILDTVCPGGELAEDGSFVLEPEEITVSIPDPSMGYSVEKQGINGSRAYFCEVFAEGSGSGIRLRGAQVESCRQSLIDRCNLVLLRPIPTLSEWGLIATAGILGIAGFIAIRRKYTTA